MNAIKYLFLYKIGIFLKGAIFSFKLRYQILKIKIDVKNNDTNSKLKKA